MISNKRTSSSSISTVHLLVCRCCTGRASHKSGDNFTLPVADPPPTNPEKSSGIPRSLPYRSSSTMHTKLPMNMLYIQLFGSLLFFPALRSACSRSAIISCHRRSVPCRASHQPVNPVECTRASRADERQVPQQI